MKNGDIIEIDGKKYEVRITVAKGRYIIDEVTESKANDMFSELGDKIIKHIDQNSETSTNDHGISDLIRNISDNDKSKIDKCNDYLREICGVRDYESNDFGIVANDDSFDSVHKRIDKIEKMLVTILNHVGSYNIKKKK